jgi:hypothetical protein
MRTVPQLSVLSAAAANFSSETSPKKAKKRKHDKLTEGSSKNKRKHEKKHKHKHKHTARSGTSGLEYNGDSDEPNLVVPLIHSKTLVLSELMSPCPCSRSFGVPTPIVAIRITTVHENKKQNEISVQEGPAKASYSLVLVQTGGKGVKATGTRVVLSRQALQINTGNVAKPIWCSFLIGKPVAVCSTPRMAAVCTRDLSKWLLLSVLDIKSGALLTPPAALSADTLEWVIASQSPTEKNGRVALLLKNGDIFFLELPSLKTLLKHSLVTSIAALLQPEQSVIDAIASKARISEEEDDEDDEEEAPRKPSVMHALTPHVVEDFSFHPRTGYPQITVSFQPNNTSAESQHILVRRTFSLNPSNELWSLVYNSEKENNAPSCDANIQFSSFHLSQTLPRPPHPRNKALREVALFELETNIHQAATAKIFPENLIQQYSKNLLDRKDVERLRFLIELIASSLRESKNKEQIESSQNAFVIISQHVMANGNRDAVRLVEEWRQCFETLGSSATIV